MPQRRSIRGVDRRHAEAGGQHAVEGGGRAAALGVAEDGGARLVAGAALDLPLEPLPDARPGARGRTRPRRRSGPPWCPRAARRPRPRPRSRRSARGSGGAGSDRQTSSMSNGRSGMRITSAPPAMPEWSAIQPAWRPITSTTITRLWLSAVVCSRSMASVATCMAVSNPKVMSVPPRSLSIVLGTPTIGRPCSAWRRAAAPSVSSPPMAIRPSRLSELRFSRIRSGEPSRASGLVREVPRIVPPRGRMPGGGLDRQLLEGVLERAAPAVAKAHDRVPVAVDALPDDRPDHGIQAGTVAASGEHAHAHDLPRSWPPARRFGADYRSLMAGAVRRGTAPLCAALLALTAAGCLGDDGDDPPKAPRGVLTVYAEPARARAVGRRGRRRRGGGAAGVPAGARQGGPAHGAPGAPRLDASGGRALGSGAGAGERRARRRRPQRRRLHRRARARGPRPSRCR